MGLYSTNPRLLAPGGSTGYPGDLRPKAGVADAGDGLRPKSKVDGAARLGRRRRWIRMLGPKRTASVSACERRAGPRPPLTVDPTSAFQAGRRASIAGSSEGSRTFNPGVVGSNPTRPSRAVAPNSSYCRSHPEVRPPESRSVHLNALQMGCWAFASAKHRSLSVFDTNYYPTAPQALSWQESRRVVATLFPLREERLGEGEH
jgi:hypothetical protein